MGKIFLLMLCLWASADLVPVFGFGENHLVNLDLPKPGTFGRKVQDLFKHYTGYYFPYYRGRLPFIDGFGFMDRQVPLVAVGKFTLANNV